MAPNPLSMAAGIMPEATPVELVECAAAAGFEFGGMWVEMADWSPTRTREVRHALKATGLTLLDIEFAWIRPGAADPDHFRLIDIGLELGVANMLCISSDPDPGATRDKLALLMDHVGDGDMRINLEFGLFTEVKTIGDASTILHQIASPKAALLIDSLHWTRSGGTLSDIASVPAQWLSYCQLCDAPLVGAHPDDADAILIEALDGRMPLGQGELAIGQLMSTLPKGIPIAIEERSKVLRDTFPDLRERAKELMRTSRLWMDRQTRPAE